MSEISNPTELQLRTIGLRDRLGNRSPTNDLVTLPLVLPDQLPLWEDRVRGLPNALARSALFTIGNSSDTRQQHKATVIFALQGIEMSYTGEELRQDDEDVFLQLIHIARLQPISQGVEVAAYHLLKELGWGTGKADYIRLRATIDRLKANALKLRFQVQSDNDREKGYAGSLIRKFEWEGKERWRIWLEPEIVKLFSDTEFTKLDWAQRKQLSAMSKKLHSFYFTHREPFGLYVKTLHQICASRIKVMAKFRYLLRKSLDELVRIGFLLSWQIDANDVVRVVRAGKTPLAISAGEGASTL